LELATLGTIADLVPLVGPNRTIVYHGLKIISLSKRVGLHALFQEAGCDIAAVSVYHIGYLIAPRLNAAGRLESAMDSLRLLCTKDPKRAEDLAYSLGRVNKERQNILFESSLHAITQVRENNLQERNILFVAHESYNEGVIGLIAGKLVETFYRPAIVVAIGEEKSKGSVRSISGFNIIEYLRLHADHFMNVGGHPMAAGFSVKTENISSLQEALEKHIDRHIADDVLQRSLKVDMKLGLAAITPELYQAIQTLSPFGMKNPEPTFLSEKVTIEDIRILGKEGKHLKLKVSAQNKNTDTHNPGLKTHNQLDAIGFGMGERYGEFKPGDAVDLVYTIDENTWQGNTKLQLKVKDVKIL
jgi:single-stranded-DNA-specific exonuclease